LQAARAAAKLPPDWGARPMKQTTREHLEFHLRRLKGARAAAAELSLKPQSGGLELLVTAHFAVLALEATLADGIEPEHSALAEVAADLAKTTGQPVPPAAIPEGVHATLNPMADWWRASFAPLGVFSEGVRRS
jgi:hypothetical protein